MGTSGISVAFPPHTDAIEEFDDFTFDGSLLLTSPFYTLHFSSSSILSFSTQVYFGIMSWAEASRGDTRSEASGDPNVFTQGVLRQGDGMGFAKLGRSNWD